MSDSEKERRAHSRVHRTFEVSGVPAPGGSHARMIGSNLSIGGLYCTSDADFPEMTRLAVRLALPGVDALDVSAVVVRRKKASSGSRGFELALLFTSVTTLQRERLTRFLSQWERTETSLLV